MSNKEKSWVDLTMMERKELRIQKWEWENGESWW